MNTVYQYIYKRTRKTNSLYQLPKLQLPILVLPRSRKTMA